MKREDLLKDSVYWTTSLQMELYRQIESFMQKYRMNQKQLAEYLGCSKGYVSQLLSGDYDHKLSKFVALSLAIGKIPKFTFVDVDEYIENDNSPYTSVVPNDIFTTSPNRDQLIINDYVIAALICSLFHIKNKKLNHNPR